MGNVSARPSPTCIPMPATQELTEKMEREGFVFHEDAADSDDMVRATLPDGWFVLIDREIHNRIYAYILDAANMTRYSITWHGGPGGDAEIREDNERRELDLNTVEIRDRLATPKVAPDAAAYERYVELVNKYHHMLWRGDDPCELDNAHALASAAEKRFPAARRIALRMALDCADGVPAQPPVANPLPDIWLPREGPAPP